MFRDDYMFPTTVAGMKQAGMVLEGANCQGGKCDKDDDGKEQVNESACESILEDAVSNYSEAQIRSDAMSAVLGWLEAGEYTYADLDSAILEVADLNGDFEIGEDEEEYYSDMWATAADALATLGATSEDVQALYDGPSEDADKAGARIGADLSKKLDEVKEDDNDIIMAFSMNDNKVLESAGEGYEGIYEGVFKWLKKVVGGVVERVHKRISGRGKKQTAAQKAALKKARHFAQTGQAKIRRLKSFRIGQKRGLHK